MALSASARDGTGEAAGDARSADRLWSRPISTRVNALVLARMQSPVALIPQLAGHIIAAGGKRLRPMLTLASARMCGYRGERHLALAAAVEFIHTATLLHDDVVDASELRRGLATANAVWGNKPSVLVGDFLFSRAFQLMVEDGSLKVLDILSRASAVIAEGEVLQLMTSNDTRRPPRRNISRSSTPRPRSCSPPRSRIGAVLGERTENEEKALEAYGRNLGIAFQLVDDMLDYSARQAELGKTVGDDFRDGKITLPVVLAFRAGDEDERQFWRRTLEEENQSADDLDRAIELMQRHGTLAATLERAAALCRDRARRAWPVPRLAGAARARRGDRFLPGTRLLKPSPPKGWLQPGRKEAISRAPECSSAW